MRLWRILLIIPFILTSISCEPIRVTTKVEPFQVEPPKQVSDVKKIPSEAIVIFDDSQISRWTHYTAEVIHTVEFPSGNLLRQALPIYFDKMFTKTMYEKSLSSMPSPKSIVIHASVDTVSFSEECCLPLKLTVNAKTKFSIYDSDLIEIALPILSSGSGQLTKPGLFAVVNNKDYGITAYEAILNSVKNSTELIYKAINNPQAQIIEAKQIINQNPSNILAYKVVANLSLKNNDIPEAFAASQMIVQIAPKEADGYFLLYKTYLAQKKYKDAFKNLEQAIAIAPKNALYMMKLFSLYINQEKYEKALKTINNYVESRPDDLYAPVWQAMTLIKMGKYNEAIETLKNHISKLEFSGVGIRIKKPEDDFVQVESVEPNSPASKAGIQKNYQIIEINGKSTSQLKLNEVIQLLRGTEASSVTITFKKPETDETFTKTLVREKFFTDKNTAKSCLSLIAIAMLEKGQIENAKQYLDEAEKIESENDNFRLAKSYYLLMQKEYQKSISEAQNVKNSDFALFLITVANLKMGNFDESVGSYKKIINSNSLLITENSKKLLFSALTPYIEKLENKAIELEKSGKISQALQEYAKLTEISNPEKAQWIRSRVSRIISSNPSFLELTGEPRNHFLKAEVLYTNNKLEEAVEELEKARQLQPFNPYIYFNKAVVYEKMGELLKAIENMEIYLQIYPSAPNVQTVKDQIFKWRVMLEKEL
ncbi:tetratricopeptide repeat protein [Thermodesulfovibrio hydrogeniphilus]